MAEAHVQAALKEKRAWLAGALQQAHGRAVGIRTDLASVAQTRKLFARQIDPGAIATRVKATASTRLVYPRALDAARPQSTARDWPAYDLHGADRLHPARLRHGPRSALAQDVDRELPGQFLAPFQQNRGI